MPLVKKLINVGDSKGIIIPREYLAYYELQGKKINKVTLEINEKITIEPFFEDVDKREDRHAK
ncbi:unnamed protein product [marine sediment metagenome]|uniref:SpoVT-AbrB domain-containing protein n=1 Tax=marine sediment metagenome TaxID=412755 RepID=X1KY62_9ZZZZ